MINLYLRDADRIGFTFHLFGEDKWINDLQSFDSSFALHTFFRKAKGDLFQLNLEHFVHSFTGEECERTQVRKEAEAAMIKAMRWSGKTIGDHYEKVIERMAKGESFADALVGSLAGQRRETALMQKSILYNFIREEQRHF